MLFSDIFLISSRACLLHSSQSVTTARTATFLHCTESSRQDFVIRIFTEECNKLTFFTANG